MAQLIAVSATERGLALVILLPLTYLAVRGIGRFRQLWAEPMDTREYRGWLNSPSLFPEWDERAYAATQAEAQLCAGDPILIVGGGNAAGQAAMFLSRHASEYRLLIRGGDLGKSKSRYLVDQIERNDLVQVCLHSEVVELGGERELETVTVADTLSGERTVVPARALFAFIGAVPHTEWLEGQLATDDAGFLLTGRDAQDGPLTEHDGHAPYFLETSRPGIFAVGDVRSGSIKRVASAVGEGSMAVRLVHDRLAAYYLQERKDRVDAHLHPPRSDSDHAAPRVRRGLRAVPRGRRPMAPSADLPGVRKGRVLR